MSAPEKKTGDYLNLNQRLYEQVSRLLKDLEEDTEVTIRERIAALIAIGRVQYMCSTMRTRDDEPEPGSKVAAYGSAFRAKTNVARARKGNSRPTIVPPPPDPFGDDSDSAA